MLLTEATRNWPLSEICLLSREDCPQHFFGRELLRRCAELLEIWVSGGSSSAFFFSLAQGAARLAQAKGGSPGASFLYEIGVNDFAQSVASLLQL